MQTSGYADADAAADADGIRTKNNMSPPPPMVGGHKKERANVFRTLLMKLASAF